MRTLILTLLFLMPARVVLADMAEVEAKRKALETQLEALDGKAGKKKARKIPGGVATLKGRAICAYLTWLTEQFNKLRDKRAELKKEYTGWLEKLKAQYEQGGIFTLEPMRTKWSAVPKKGKIKLADTVAVPGGEIDIKAVLTFVAAERLFSYSHVKADETSAAPFGKAAGDDGVFKLFQGKKVSTVVIAYIRSKEAQKAKITIDDLQKTNSLEAVYVNGKKIKAKAKKAAKVKLLEGVNGLVFIIANPKGGDMSFSVSLDGKDLEAGALGP